MKLKFTFEFPDSTDLLGMQVLIDEKPIVIDRPLFNQLMEIGSILHAIRMETDFTVPIFHDVCPQDGDPTNDCNGCAYSAEYMFKDGECIEREEVEV